MEVGWRGRCARFGSLGSQRIAALLTALSSSGCYHVVHRPGLVERRVLDRYDPMALPVRSEPTTGQWPSPDAPMVRSDVVLVGRDGRREVVTRARAERDGASVVVDHGPGWPSTRRYPVDEVGEVYIDRVVVEPGRVKQRELDVTNTVLATALVVIGAGLTVWVGHALRDAFTQE